MRIRGQAARSIGLSASFWVRLCHPFTLRIVIWPEASSAQNNIAAVSADGSTVWVLIRRLNSSWSRSIALVVRALFHWLGGSRVKVKSRSRNLGQCLICLIIQEFRDSADLHNSIFRRHHLCIADSQAVLKGLRQ